MALDFAAIFADAPVAAMVLDRELRFVAANGAYQRMVGKTEDEVRNRYVFDVFPEDPERVEAMLAIFRETLSGGTPAIEDFPYVMGADGARVERWFTASHAPLKGADGDIGYLVQYSQDVTDRVRLRHMRDAVMGELRHRIGNLFAVVGALARRVAREAEDVPEFMADFEARLSELHRAEADLGVERSESRDIREVINDQLEVYVSHARGRVSGRGPARVVSPGVARAVSMAVHELSTNSLKYGALRNSHGRIDVTWDLPTDGGLRFVWEETGVGTTHDTTRTGYGTHLLMNVLPAELNGTADRRFEKDVFRYTLTMPGPAETLRKPAV